VQSCDRGSAFPTSAATFTSSIPSTRKYLPSPAYVGSSVVVTREPEWSPTPVLLTVAASVCCGRPVWQKRVSLYMFQMEIFEH
jgi:hypothetical protein